MNGAQLQHALRAGKQVYGTLVTSTSPKWPAVIGNLGMDFVFIDTENVAIDRQQVSWMCRTFAAMNLCPIVRIPAPDPYHACMMFDAGASGIVAPYVETVEEVKALRGAAKLAPLKGRRLQRIINADEQCRPELQKYLDEKNHGKLLIVNIESLPALEALDDILSVPQLDAILIGPHDLSCSLGVPAQYDHPTYLAAVREIIHKARAAGVAAGIHNTYTLEHSIKSVSEGANLLIHSGDIMVFSRQLKKELDAIKQALEPGITLQKSKRIEI